MRIPVRSGNTTQGSCSTSALSPHKPEREALSLSPLRASSSPHSKPNTKHWPISQENELEPQEALKAPRTVPD